MKIFLPEDFIATYEIRIGYEIGLVGKQKTKIEGEPLKLITLEEAANRANELILDGSTVVKK